MITFEDILVWVQLELLLALAVFGLHRGWLVVLYLRQRKHLKSALAAPSSELPTITVQLPIYNERYVAARLITAAAALDYPLERFSIQVLDDSTDDTCLIVQQTIAQLPADLRITHLRRVTRTGFKAGALAEALHQTDAELLAMFDADFIPPRGFLREMVPAFRDPKVGMVQARWEHLNAGHSLLTTLQSYLLDGHFIIEHAARATNGLFFNFNGTAGIFRRTCIDDAGGWQHDTLTEDLDLSYRAQLRGWLFLYRPDLACPAELPVDINAFLSQQHRWAKGSVQTAKKLLPTIWSAKLPLLTKIEATFHLLGNVGFLLLLILILIALPIEMLRQSNDVDSSPLVVFIEGWPIILSTLCVLFFCGTAQRSRGRLRVITLLRLPLVLVIGAGMCVNNSKAIFEGLRKNPGEFLRTPKRGNMSRSQGIQYHSRRGLLPFVELAVGFYALATIVFALQIGDWGTALFHALFAAGLIWVGARSLAASMLTSPAT